MWEWVEQHPDTTQKLKMGNNEAFSSFEASVMACYDHGVLSKSLLSALMEPYRDMDIDSGGMAGTLSKKDKLDVVEVTIKAWGRTTANGRRNKTRQTKTGRKPSGARSGK